MMHAQPLPWMEPLQVAQHVDEPYWVLLYSAVQSDYSGRYSFLACGLETRVEGEDFSLLRNCLSSDSAYFDAAWFGYLGYGLKDSLETLIQDTPGWFALPHACLMRFRTIYQFDHMQKQVICWSSTSDAIYPTRVYHHFPVPTVSTLTSNMTRTQYLEKAANIIDRIHAGELYQANLTRKFFGSFTDTPCAYTLFCQLCKGSPASFSAYMRLGDTHLISSSPERFLSVGANGDVSARPIKGTAPRSADAAKDRAARDTLAASEKDRAENLMIVDLMRNDLARSCIPGSVKAEELFSVTSHANVHHMSSTITGMKRLDCSTADVVANCFPPGSMTGAPKIKAMNVCSELEQQARGVYSGALGWFGGDGSCELSVVIRTLIVQGNRFEFQVGGGIVADSTPEGEHKEITHKAQGLLSALGLAADALEEL